jgi:hypothetical protein
MIRSRTEEGIKRAKAEGTVFGKHVLDDGQKRCIAKRFASGETMAELTNGTAYM